VAPPQNQKVEMKPDADAVARAATERAERLERELAAAKAELEKRKEPVSIEVPEAFKGTITYRLTQAHYRRGRLYGAGETITVTDERPGKSWVAVKAVPTTELVDVVPVVVGRAADQQV
jgi:hypothetical protein